MDPDFPHEAGPESSTGNGPDPRRGDGRKQGRGDGRDERLADRRNERLGTLLRRLASDSGELLRNEVELAKLEVRESVTQMTKGVTRIALAASVAALGAMALTAFLVIALGNLLGGPYWAGALIIGVVLLAVGGILLRRGLTRVKEAELRPDETIRTLKQDSRWAKQEIGELLS